MSAIIRAGHTVPSTSSVARKRVAMLRGPVHVWVVELIANLPSQGPGTDAFDVLEARFHCFIQLCEPRLHRNSLQEAMYTLS